MKRRALRGAWKVTVIPTQYMIIIITCMAMSSVLPTSNVSYEACLLSDVYALYEACDVIEIINTQFSHVTYNVVVYSFYLYIIMSKVLNKFDDKMTK